MKYRKEVNEFTDSNGNSETKLTTSMMTDWILVALMPMQLMPRIQALVISWGTEVFGATTVNLGPIGRLLARHLTLQLVVLQIQICLLFRQLSPPHLLFQERHH